MPEMLNLAKKVLLLGDPSVGKTSLIRKYVYDVFDDKYISTLGAKVSSKRMLYNHPEKDLKVELKLMIWDVMGQKEYAMIHQSAYGGAQGALLVCDTTRRETLESLTSWINDLYNVTGAIPTVLIGNKCDLTTQRKIAFEDISAIGKSINSPVYLGSAKTGENVEASFFTLAEKMVQVDVK
jgi:small GTP-binding protein